MDPFSRVIGNRKRRFRTMSRIPNRQLAGAIHRLLAGSITAGAAVLGAAGPALAQENLGEIVVTGSRIRSANLESTTPVTQVTAADVVTQGVTRIEDLVNQLPQAFATQNVTVSNGATGTATLDLRNLGSPRTLVLIDGRRMPYGGVTNSAADINQIPTQMVERVDILTGGASAVYGSDAVAGVVNFIMKKDFEGVEITSQYNFYWHENDYKGPGATKLRDTIAARSASNPSQFQLPDDTVTDGEGKELSLLVGVNSGDGRGNITAYATVFDSNAVLQADRDYSACTVNPNPTTSFTCGGSATSHTGRFTTFGSPSYPGGPAYNLTTLNDTDMRPYCNTTDLYNYGPLNYYQRPERRYSLGAMGHYEFGEHADVYMQLMYTDYESTAQVAPGGNFFDTDTVNCDNPLLPSGALDDIGCDPARVAAGESILMYIGRRNVEGGGRQNSFSNSSYRIVAGVRGAINDAWSYDASAQYSRTTADQFSLNYFVKDRMVRALDVVDDGTGTPVCRSVLDGSDSNCVPWNPFVPNGITQDQLDYLQATGLQTGRLTQEIYNGVVSGDLGVYGFKTPWATDGVQVVFGTEYRRDTMGNTVDALQEQDQLAGQGGATIGISGAVKAQELFFEGRVPLAQDRPGLESLSLDTAYRYSDYDDFSTDTYKVGLEWAPVADVRFRASYQRAVRAANIVELFTAQGFNLFDASGDPCGVADPNPNATAAECIATGVPASFYDGVNDLAERGALDSPATQYNYLQGGNTELTPETSDTYSYGIVFTPRFAPGLAITLDYFDIQIDDTISTFDSVNTWAACYDNGDAAACGRIQRNPGNGSLWVGDGHVEDTNINIGALATKGYDLNVNYTGLEIGRFGSLNFNLTGTYVVELVTTPETGVDFNPDPDKFGDSYDCVGYFSSVCGQPTPEWRHRFRTSWITPWDVDVSLTWRHYGGTTGINGPNEPMPSAQIDRKMSGEDYFDLSANWAVTEKAAVTLGINNVFDDNPSISGSVGTTGNGNTFPQTYDALGRYVFVRARVGF
jgi:outer membrane receptor protein involved in Fe transport